MIPGTSGWDLHPAVCGRPKTVACPGHPFSMNNPSSILVRWPSSKTIRRLSGSEPAREIPATHSTSVKASTGPWMQARAGNAWVWKKQGTSIVSSSIRFNRKPCMRVSSAILMLRIPNAASSKRPMEVQTGSVSYTPMILQVSAI